MMKNKNQRTTDIMSNLMQENRTINKDNNITIEHVSNNMPSKQENNKEINSVINKKINDSREKTTFNLRMPILSQLDETWITLRRKKFKQNHKVTKTQLVELALEMAFEDLKENGELSKFYRKLNSVE